MYLIERSRLISLLILFVTACSNTTAQKTPNQGIATLSASSNCQIVPHDFGKTKICGQPQRVVAIGTNALDLLLSLGIEPVGYAEDGRALIGSPQAGKPTVGVKYLGKRMKSHPVHIGTRQSPSLETILRLKPDLILGDFSDQSLYSNLSQMAPALFPYQDYESDSDRWQQELRQLGKIMQREHHAQQVIDEHHQRIAQAKVKLKPVSRNSKVLLLSMSGLDRISVFNDETFAGNLLRDIGFQLALPQHLPVTYGEINISLETLPQINADLIIVMASGDSSVEKVKTEWWQNPILRSLPPSQAGRVYFVDYQLWSRIAGPIAAEIMLDQIQELLL